VEQRGARTMVRYHASICALPVAACLSACMRVSSRSCMRIRACASACLLNVLWHTHSRTCGV